jgi:hypothetical protein
MLAAFLAADPTATTAFDWAKAVGGLGGSAMLALGTFAWYRGLIVTRAELKRAQDAGADALTRIQAAAAVTRNDLQSIIATKDLQLAAKDELVERKDEQLAAAMQTLVDETVPALVKATVVMEHQQAELRARRTQR